jgi:hypothetical protein
VAAEEEDDSIASPGVLREIANFGEDYSTRGLGRALRGQQRELARVGVELPDLEESRLHSFGIAWCSL